MLHCEGQAGVPPEHVLMEKGVGAEMFFGIGAGKRASAKIYRAAVGSKNCTNSNPTKLGCPFPDATEDGQPFRVNPRSKNHGPQLEVGPTQLTRYSKRRMISGFVPLLRRSQRVRAGVQRFRRPAKGRWAPSEETIFGRDTTKPFIRRRLERWRGHGRLSGAN